MNVFVIDTETTGFVEPIVSVAVGLAHISRGPLDAYFNCYHEYFYNPGKPIEYGAMATHLISNTEAAKHPLYEEFKFPPETDYLIGHNIDYDWKVLGSPPLKRICTEALSRYVYPDAGSHKLTALYLQIMDEILPGEGVDIGIEAVKRDAHSVKGDIKFCFSLLCAIIAKLRPDSWEELWAISEVARVPTVMPFGKHRGEKIADMPSSYKKWLLGQSDVDPYLRKALETL